MNNNDKSDHYHRYEFKPRLGGRENATVSRANHGTRGKEGECHSEEGKPLDCGEEGECHSEKGKPWD